MALADQCAAWRKEVSEALPEPFKGFWPAVRWRSGIAKTPYLFESLQWLKDVVVELNMPFEGEPNNLSLTANLDERRQSARALAAFRRGLRQSAGLPNDEVGDLKRVHLRGVEFQKSMDRYKPSEYSKEQEDIAIQWQADTAALLDGRQRDAFLQDDVFRVDIGDSETQCFIDIRPSLDYLQSVIDTLEAEKDGAL